jgi:hypothetical protein
MKTLGVLLFVFMLFPAELRAQARKPATISELVTYNGADREQVLYAGAKNEGKLTWYTSLAGDSYKAMVKAFESNYPGVKIEAYRVSGSDITTRMFEESKAKRYIADTVETTEGNLMFMRDAFLLRPYHSPHFASYPEEAKFRRAASSRAQGAHGCIAERSNLQSNRRHGKDQGHGVCQKTQGPGNRAAYDYPARLARPDRLG